MVKHHREAELAIRTAGGLPAESARVIPQQIRDYTIVGIIGEGGMGIVYLGRREVEGAAQSVAIKVDGSAIGSVDAQRRFLSERAILAGIDHPFIAQIFDWGNDEDGRAFQVMEFINGLPVDEYVNSNQLADSDIVDLLQKVCVAIEASHRNLVIHRDIKPSNILITQDGFPKLIDFGIAKQLDQSDLTIAGQLAFTPAYASPEQIKGEQLTTATDVYSLGIVMYKLFCAQLPYDISTLSWRDAQDFAGGPTG